MQNKISRANLDVAVADLVPYANNSRTHSDEQIDQIAASIREFGFTNPLLIDENKGLIAGHGRLMAAVKIGLVTVPAVMLTGLTAAQKKALVLADNKLALNAGWDKKLLDLEIRSLAEAGFNLDLTGFSKIEVGNITGLGAASAGEDDSSEPPAQARSVPGDMWLLGPHRVRCGDSTVETDVASLFADLPALPNIMVTDPPYGVEYDADWRNHAGNETRTVRATGKVINDDRADWREAWALFPGKVAYVWHAGPFAPVVAESLVACGFKLRSQIIWAKNNFAIGRGDYHWKHEPCWYAVREGSSGNWCSDRKQTTLWDIDKPQKSETGHSTQKPVECMRRPMLNNSAPGDVVYDPFLGSGTSIIAAESCGRICVGMELNPAYIDVIVKRWQDFTGKEATHAETGKKFNDMKPKQNQT